MRILRVDAFQIEETAASLERRAAESGLRYDGLIANISLVAKLASRSSFRYPRAE
jgi:hypothetical protein